MPDTFKNGERVAATETEVAHIKEQLANNSAELAAIRVTLAEMQGGIKMLSWLWKAAIAIGGIAATIFGFSHGTS